MQRGESNPLLTVPGRLAAAYATFAGDAWRRGLALGAGYAGRVAGVAVEAAGVRQAESDLVRMALQGTANAAAEFATIPVASYGEALRTWERAGAPRLADHSPMHMVDGRAVLLPLRFARARQGWALYRAEPSRAAEALAAHGLDGPFEPWTVGGRALVIVYGIDFIETDLGAYQEIGIEMWARPRGSRWAAPGIVTLRMAVNPADSIAPARQIWNFDKLWAPRMDVRVERHHATFVLDAADPYGFALTLPRFGKGRSTRVPVRYLTPSPHGAGAPPLCGVLQRSAEGEGVQFGGEVTLRLGTASGGGSFDALAGETGSGKQRALRALGLEGAEPTANGWAERMRGTMTAPYPLTG